MPITYLPSPASATLAVAQTETSFSLTTFQTVLLVIIAGALLYLARNLFHLKNRLATLEGGSSSASKPSPAAPLAPIVSAPSAEGVGPEIVAAISAAVHTTLRARARIISVGEICPQRQAWSAEGRRQVFSSHKVR